MTISQTITSGRAVLLVASATLALVGLQLRDPLLRTSALSFLSVGGSAERQVSPVALPFSFDDVTNYFSDTMGGPPNELRQNHAIFEDGTIAKGLFNITIIQQGSEILIRFRVIDDYGMNFIREFFEAPFFEPVETEQLYSLLYMGEGIHCSILSRFDVLYEYDTRPEATVVTLFFSPPVRIVK